MSFRIKSVLRLIKSLLLVSSDTLVLASQKEKTRERCVLLIRTDAIGDFVLWSDSGRELCRYYRDCGFRVILLANALWARWAEELQLADEIWAFDPHRFSHNLPYRWRWLQRLGGTSFVKVVHTVHSRRFLIEDTLARAARAPEKIAPKGDGRNIAPWEKRWSDTWYSRLVAGCTDTSMELIRHAEFLRGLGLTQYVASVPKLKPIASSEHCHAVARPYAVLFIGASWEGKIWQPEKFIQIAQRFLRRGIHVVLTGSDADRDRALVISRALDGNVVNLAGMTTLSDLAELARSAFVVVSNDTSAVHIAASVGTRVICILGGGHYGRFLPYAVERQDASYPVPVAVVKPMECFGCNWECSYPRLHSQPVKCISDISADDVWTKIEETVSFPSARGAVKA